MKVLERLDVFRAQELQIEKKVVSEAGSEAPPETLADKVAQARGDAFDDFLDPSAKGLERPRTVQDFKNPALVTPSEQHVVADAHMMMFGGVVPGQKFTMDKHIHCRTKVEKQQKGGG